MKTWGIACFLSCVVIVTGTKRKELPVIQKAPFFYGRCIIYSLMQRTEYPLANTKSDFPDMLYFPAT